MPTDSIAGLVDSSRLMLTTEQALAQACRTGERVAVLSFGLNGLQREGTARLAAGIAPFVRRADTLGVLDNGELLLVHRAVKDLEGVATLARKLLNTTSVTHFPESSQGGRVSIGISMNRSAVDVDGLLGEAAQALRRARLDGGGTYHFAAAGHGPTTQDSMRLQEELHRALKQGEFFLEFQPQVRLRDGQVVCREALIRWNHPRWGVLGPGRFISAAEKSGIIEDIGEWAVREACQRCLEWNGDNLTGTPVAVNVSAVELASSGFVERTMRILGEVALDPRLLELELTETVVPEDFANLASTLGVLSDLGVGCVLDDFGTGYSFLRHLSALPVHKVKVAGDFVREAPSNREIQVIIKGVVGLAHDLGLTVVAEGAETRRQLVNLATLCCDSVQGFVLGKPSRQVNDAGRSRPLRLESPPTLARKESDELRG